LLGRIFALLDAKIIQWLPVDHFTISWCGGANDRYVYHSRAPTGCLHRQRQPTRPWSGPTRQPASSERSGCSQVVWGPYPYGRSRHGAPERNTQKMPLRMRRSSTRGMPRGLLGSIGLMTLHS